MKVMDYFDVWKAVQALDYDDSDFCRHFLANDSTIEDIFNKGSEDELSEAIDVLSSISLERLIQCIEPISRDFRPADIPCFSSLDKGLKRVSELLVFHEDGLTFQELGYLLNGATTSTACIKYGENHSKLAAIASLVEITESKPARVKATALGQFLLTYSDEEKKDIIQKMLIRDPYIQQLLIGAINGGISYKESVSSLRLSTAIRRRTSVKAMITYILDRTDYKDCIKTIDWSV